MQYHFYIHGEKSGRWAQCVELPGCVTEGDTEEELWKNMKEALNLYLSEPEDSRQIFPLPKTRVRAKNVIGVPVEPRVALGMLVRQARLRMGLPQHAMAKKLGFKNVSAYQKLEKPTANPTLRTLQRLKKVVPDLSLDEVVGM